MYLTSCVYNSCSKCESIPDIDQDRIQCGKRKHTFWDDPFGDMLSYLCESRPWVERIKVIAHNAKDSVLHFILHRAILLKWKVELIMNSLKITCMRMEHLLFLDSISFLTFALRKLSDAFGLTVSKSWYPHYFNTRANLDYVGKFPDVLYYGVDEMSASEREDFLAWYEVQRDQLFDNRRVLASFCQDDVSVLREACRILRREFLQIGKINVFLESIPIASACNKLLRKRFLKPDTIGLIPSGGYSGNVNYSKKAMMWLLYRERTDGCKILHARNVREFRPPELPNLSVDGFCPETKTVYEFLGCFYHGDTCQPFRDVTTLRGDTLAERYE